MVPQKKLESIYYKMVKKAQQKTINITTFNVFQKDGIKAEIDYFPICELNKDYLSWIFDLEKRNMEKMYDLCSWGWKQKKKEKEMTEREARYIIAKIDSDPIAFSHFRFDMDHGDPVLYCYELQVEPKARGKGLGKFLLQLLEQLAFENNMKKVVLTVLKHNHVAVNFFASMNYTTDETDPNENKFDSIPYKILSKRNKNFALDVALSGFSKAAFREESDT